jgi:hypothetical protein
MIQTRIAFRSVAALVALAPLAAPLFGLSVPVERTYEGAAMAEPAPAVPGLLARFQVPVEGDSLEARAREFLHRRAGKLGLVNAGDEELAVRAVRQGRAVDVVRFRQMAGGHPVYRGEIAVSFNRNGEVIYVTSDLRPILELEDALPQVEAAAARSVAIAHLGIGGHLNLDRSTLVVFPGVERARLAWWIHLVPFAAPHGDWHVLVDAVSGEILRSENMALDFDGTGYAFLPDPLSSAGVAYGTAGYVDGADADTPELIAEISAVTLRDLTFLDPDPPGDGFYTLTGPWADCRELESPVVACPTDADGIFPLVGRASDDFEPQNVYYHIDAFMRYINATLLIPVTPYQYVGGVRFDPHGFNGSDNSHYLSGTGVLAFGDGGVDDAEDPDVVIHELGHGLHDWLTSGGLSQSQGLSEGLGDYFGISYSRRFPGQWLPTDAHYNWMFGWDGHNPFWPGRVTNYNDTNLYPGGSTQIHTMGQYWASCNIDIAELIGYEEADAAVIEGISMTGSSTNQAAAAQAVYNAAEALAYPASTLQTILAVYNSNSGSAGCNYGVEGALFDDGFESTDTSAWSLVFP